MRVDWKKIWEAVEHARNLEPRERAAYVDDACGADAAFRREVEALLEVFDRHGDDGAPGLAETELLPGPNESALYDAPGQLRVGTVVDGKYRIDAVLGTGGMGHVYRATHIQLERPVALKAIRGELLTNRVMAERFRREAVAVARLRHPHIVTVHDYGVAAGIGAYLVMELLEGHSLREEMTGHVQFDVPTALAVIAQVCAAVGAAHSAGVIHRDIKPENIFLEKRNGDVAVKVVDFGLARLEAAFQSTGVGLTHGGEVLGTPGYMSPEQCRGEEADARSDIYAIGCVLYEMLTGERPFNGKTIWAVVYQHVNDEPRRPSEHVPALDPKVDEAILKALAKSPSDRHQTADAFADALGAPEVSATPPGLQTVAPGGIALLSIVARADSIEGTPVTGRANNLPHAVTHFVGREREIAEVRDWLTKARLVTLVGPGGIGKTRLALETAARVLGEYEDGVWLVELASLTEPALLPHTLGSVLGVRDQGGRSETGHVEEWLRDKRVLLVLDNCEHLVAACAQLTERLLAGCAGLTVLATSRESLAIAGEAAWPVPALAVPGARDGRSLDSEAVRLFVDRASLANPNFEVNETALSVVAELCRRLEGIPLAIELAAARVKALTVEQILERLADRFRLLAGGSRSAPTRQQTLRAALDWSYDLLTDDERALLQRLSVFAGGWTIETAEAVAGAVDVLDLLTRLVDKSLVVAQGHRPRERFRMLEIVREYAHERLREAGLADSIARRHADVFHELAKASNESFIGPQEVAWLTRLESEHDNFRAALAWYLEHDTEAALGLATELSGFWSLRGYFTEGLRWLTVSVERSDPALIIPRTIGLRCAGELAWRKGDLEIARAQLEESMRMAHEAGDARQIAWSTFHLALVMQQEGHPQESCPYLEESLMHARAIGDDRLTGNVLNSLGEAARMVGDWAAAIPYYEQSLAVHRSMDHPVGFVVTLCNLGGALCDAGDLDGAHACYGEALPALREQGNTVGMSLAIDGLGAVAARRSEWERAARLAGVAEALRREVDAELEPADRSMRERYLQNVRDHLDDSAFDEAIRQGRGMALDGAIEDALSA